MILRLPPKLYQLTSTTLSVKLIKSKMPNHHRFSIIFLSYMVFLLHFYFFPSNTIAAPKSYFQPVEVSLSIGEFRFTLFGYTSPGAKVTISGLGIYDETYADETGYFIFKNRFSPLSPREACLTAQDTVGRLSPPVCLPPFPTIYNVEIGPVIMPPTISVDVGEYLVGDQAILTGQTIPNTDVNFSLFADQSIIEKGRNLLSFNLIKNVEAFSLPILETKSDEKGNFSISLPTNHPTTFRAFARSNFEKLFSPKSLTLNVKVLPWWMVIVKFFGLIFGLIKKRLLEILLLVEFVVLILIVLNHFFHPHRLAKTRAIVLREKWELLPLS